MKKARMKKEAVDIIDALPDDTSWDELIYRLYVRQKIEKGFPT